MRLAGMFSREGFALERVALIAHRLQVIRIDAAPHPALVIEHLIPAKALCMRKLIRNTVSFLLPAVHENPAVAIAIDRAKEELTARVGLRNGEIL